MVLLIAGAVGAVMAMTGAGAGVERALHGLRDAARQHKASGDFMLVEIDARSVDSLDRWPWPRGLYVDAIAALQKAGASTIAFDVDFSAHSSPDEDRAFGNAIDKATVPVVLPTFRQYGSLAGGAMLENLPIPILRRGAQLAAVNISADSDGLVRHYPFGIVTGGVPRPSVGAMLAGAGGQAGTSFPIDGAIDPASIPRVSFVDLIQGRVPGAALKGKAVLIGATAIELGDRYSVQRYGVIPGPVIQLLAAETLRDGSSPFDHGPALPLLGALMVLAIAVRCGRRVRVAIIGGGVASLILLPLAMEAGDVGTVGILPALSALSVGALTLAIVSILATLRDARLLDPTSGLPNRRGFEHATRVLPIGAVTVLKIANYSEAAAVVGQQRAAEMVKRIVDRLAIAGVAHPYRLEEGVLAWTADAAQIDRPTHEIERAAAILRTPIEVGGRQIELRCNFGVACGDDAAPGILADRAILAADHAVERGTRWEVHSAELGEAQDWRLMRPNSTKRLQTATSGSPISPSWTL